MIYLDYAANYPTKKEVLDELVKVELTYEGNANSIHEEGKKSKEYFSYVNNEIKKILSLGDDKEIIYTSSATESNNLAIKGVVEAYSSFGNKVLVSELEHSSINGCLGYLKDKGIQVEFIKTKDDGHIDEEDLKKKLTSNVILVVIGLVDGELGTVQDYKKISEIVSSSSSHLLMDVTQGMMKVEIDFSYIELASFTPHKFGGLTGTGVLIKNKETILTPLIHGGESSSIYRSGSIPLGLIASTYKALEIGMNNFSKNNKIIEELSSYLITKLQDEKNIHINSFENKNIFNLSYKGKKGSYMVEYLSSKGICVSQKSACSIKNTPSKIVMAVYKNKELALSSFRVSISEYTKKEDIDALIDALKELEK